LAHTFAGVFVVPRSQARRPPSLEDSLVAPEGRKAERPSFLGPSPPRRPGERKKGSFPKVLQVGLQMRYATNICSF